MEETQFFRFGQYLQLQMRVADRYNRQIAGAAKSLGLSKPEADVLLFLFNNPQRNAARDVAACRGFSKTYVSKALEQLTARGLVQATSDPRDRRVQLLRLTPEAEPQARQLREAQTAFFRRMLRGCAETDAQALLRLTRQIEENLAAGL